MIIVNNLTKVYRNKAALNSINLELSENKIVGLVGPNGAGKTTFLKCISNLVTTYYGSILIKEGTTIGLVLDNLKAYQNKSLRFNLEYFRIAKGLSTYENSLKVLDILNFDLSLMDDKLRTFSYGMNQKIMVAISLMSNPDIILLDEPFRGLDEASIADFKKLLNMFKQQNKLIIFSSHNLRDVENICDEVIVLNKGNHLTTVNNHELLNSNSVRFNTNNNEYAMELLKEYNPIFSNNMINVNVDKEVWKVILQELLNNDVEIIDINRSSKLAYHINTLLREERNV